VDFHNNSVSTATPMCENMPMTSRANAAEIDHIHIDVFTVKRRLHQIHSEFRNQGLNSLEAIPKALAQVVATDGNIRSPFEGVDRGDLFSMVVQEFLLAGARFGLGQYLTPLPVSKFLASQVVSGRHPKSVIDPFCGAGLLLEQVGVLVPSASFVGVEINSPMAGVAKSLAQISESKIDIRKGDSFKLFLEGRFDSFDTVVANPPFGATASSVSSSDSRIPQELRNSTGIPSEILGIEVCVSILKPGGVLGIVLPTSVLTNKSWSGLRRYVFRNLEITNAISLPPETFSPFKGVANSCVLIGKKVSKRKVTAVGFWESKEIGYDDTGRNTATCDLDQIHSQINEGLMPAKTIHVDSEGIVRIERKKTKGKSWTLSQVAEVFAGKNPPSGQYADTGPFLLKVGDLSGEMLTWRSRKKNHIDPTWFSRYKKIHLQPGDLCLTAAAHRARYIGLKVDLVFEVPEVGAMPSGEVMVIRPLDSSPFSPEQLLLYFRSSDGYEQIQDAVRGSTGHLYAQDVLDIRIPNLDDLYPKSETRALFTRIHKAFRTYQTLAEEVSVIVGSGLLKTEMDSDRD
jgi:type I restriction enzyme M protein